MISGKTDYPWEVQIAFLEATGPGSILWGPFTDWHGEHGYTARMWAQKVDAPVPDENILAIKPSQIEGKGILEYFSQPPAFKVIAGHRASS